MTYIDDKYNKRTSKKESDEIPYMMPRKKNRALSIIGIICVFILAFLAIITVISVNRIKPDIGNEQEDTGEILSQIAGHLNAYIANNRGAIPGQGRWNNFWNEYVGEVTDSKGSSYRLAAACKYGDYNSKCVAPSNLTWQNNKQEIYIVTQATCNDDIDLEPSNITRDFAIYTVLSDDSVACVSTYK